MNEAMCFVERQPHAVPATASDLSEPGRLGGFDRSKTWEGRVVDETRRVINVLTQQTTRSGGISSTQSCGLRGLPGASGEPPRDGTGQSATSEHESREKAAESGSSLDSLAWPFHPSQIKKESVNSMARSCQLPKAAAPQLTMAF
ncbi:hypothetical protein CMUS01_00677 [Colletotrichum musicola]|uniref:Uncharacterized protein n=1 Tax=Colletotrichum musicola TaxID=2175873 RepID=A0A8H6NYQ1_9PEZI|nr:hypothetical protein CMUS01_00677 [Colletotrichum musicola]